MIVRERTRRAISRSAFTLLEILVVMAIILMLAGIGGVYFLNQQKHSQKNAAAIQCRTLIQACEQFAANNLGTFPSSLLDLGDPTIPGGPYLKDESALFPPWDRNREQPYQYSPPQGNSAQPHVWTVHPDGTPIGNPPQ